jgi:hypothetical protein
MAVAARPMEKPEHCLQVPPPRVCRMVPSGQHVLRMENIRGSRFPSMGSWETSVNANSSCLFHRLKLSVFRSGCRKERTLVRQTFHIPIRRTHRVGSSTIIGDVDAMRKAGLASLAFFYCDFREDQKKDLRGLLSSLLVQLCHQSNSYSDILSKLYSEHDNGSRHPSDDALAGCLKDLLYLPGHAPVYLIVDALDECSNTSSVPSPRDEVLNLIEELIKSQIPHLRICVTSRPETDIKDFLEPLVLHIVSLHDESGQNRDIEEYIKSVINTNPKNKRWKAADKHLVIDVLTEKADGM